MAPVTLQVLEKETGKATCKTSVRFGRSHGEVVVNISGAFKINIRVMTSSFVSSAKALSWLS